MGVIGFTERGDAGLDLSWFSEENNETEGLVLITKNINDRFIEKVIEQIKYKPVILHATCTGYGSTIVEPNVPDYRTQLNQLKKLVEKGFPFENVVLRVDPIIPVKTGLENAKTVIAYADSIGILPKRVRISILDMYPHTRNRFAEIGIPDFYEGKFMASPQQMANAEYALNSIAKEFNVTIETCAEPELMVIAAKRENNKIKQCGCISEEDLKTMKLEHLKTTSVNGQQRHGCLCLGIKKELLKNKCRCPHKCVYCFWRD